jgi:hypothetical protein
VIANPNISKRPLIFSEATLRFATWCSVAAKIASKTFHEHSHHHVGPRAVELALLAAETTTTITMTTTMIAPLDVED